MQVIHGSYAMDFFRKKCRYQSVLLFFVFTIVLLGGPSCKTANQSNILSSDTVTLERKDGYRIINMLYGTARERDENVPLGADDGVTTIQDTVKVYGKDRVTSSQGPNDHEDKNNYGLVSVNVPVNHKTGIQEVPGWAWDKKFKKDNHFGMVRLFVYEKGRIKSILNDAQLKSNRPSVLVFVHGFNVSFAEAAITLAQFVNDAGFPGVPILYSWASQGEVSSYTNDEETVRATRIPFRNFLEHIRASVSPDTEITILAHSMGNRLALDSLGIMAEKYRTAPASAPMFNQVIMAAPDVDSSDFKNMYSASYPIAKRWSLYANEYDMALQASIAAHYASRKWQGDGVASRAGQGGEKLLLMDGLESIDMSDLNHDVLAHNVFAANPRAIVDLRNNIVYGKTAAERPYSLEKTKTINEKIFKYWILNETSRNPDPKVSGVK